MTEQKLWVDDKWRKKLIDTRLKRGYTTKYMAAKLKIHPSTYSRYERGDVDHLSKGMIDKLSKILNADMNPIPDNYEELVEFVELLQKENDSLSEIVTDLLNREKFKIRWEGARNSQKKHGV